MLPEAVAAATYLHAEGVAANVLHVTSPRRLFETWQRLRPLGQAGSHESAPPFAWLIPASERQAPIITVQDAASHAMSWLGSVYGTRVTALGVDDWGQSGTRADLYDYYDIGTDAIVQAAFAALDERR
jgi:pyruvate dehydrogenase E1 component